MKTKRCTVGFLLIALLLFAGIGTARADLVGYWSFDATDGSGDFIDSSGNNNTGYRENYTNPTDPTDNPTVVAGKYGDGVHFDSNKQQYMEILDSPELRLGSDFAIAMWFKTDSTDQVQKYLWGPNAYGILYEYANDKVEMYSIGQTGTHPRAGSALTVANTDWHHIVYAKEGTSYRGYLDGSEVFSLTRDFAFAQLVNSHFLGAASAHQNHVSGTFDDVAVWDAGLSGDQVKAMVNQITTPLNADRRIDDVTYTYGGYVSSQPHTSYPDNGGIELTDAKLSSGWAAVGFRDSLGPGGDDGNPHPQIDFDLQEVLLVGEVRIDYTVSQAAGINAPDSLDIRVYEDAAFTTLLQSSTHTGFVNIDGNRSLTIDFPGIAAQFVRLDFYNDQEWTFLDEVTFFTIPEPSTVGLLVMGGLALLSPFGRRRRRRG